MECFIVENGVERKAGLEDILPLLDDRLIQHLFINAYKTISLQYALAFLPEEIKNKVYRNMSIRIIGKIRNAVKNLESAKEAEENTEDMLVTNDNYFEEARAELISFIGENINILYGSPDCLIWKETKPEEKLQVNPVEDIIKRIENACSSKELYLLFYLPEKMWEESLQNAFAAFHDRKNELQNIRRLIITAKQLPAAAPLFENTALDTLSISGEFDGTWPEFMENCENITSIILEVNNVAEFPSWIRNAVSLRTLYISNLPENIYIPDWIGDLQSLTEFTIYSKNLKTLPDGLGKFKNLTKLTVDFASIERMPDSIGNLSSLKDLYLYGNQALTSLPDSIGNLTNLNKLTIDTSFIEKLPESFGNLSSLKELTLESNEKLTSLPDSICNLTNLTHLIIQHSAIEKLPESFGNLSSLKKLRLVGNNKLTSLPDSIGNLKDLTDFFLLDSNVKVIPDSIGNLQNLTELSLDGSKIKKLPDSIGNLKNLSSLVLSNTAIEILPDTLANCSSLEYVDICHTAITTFPNFITSIKTLKQSRKVMPEKRCISYLAFCNYYYTLVETIFRFSEKARNEGILALEEELEEMSDDIFKTGIRLLVDGIDRTIIREFFTLKIEREHDYYIKNLWK
jgi:Leucine-rich repeat (LRR) protein